MVDYGPCSGVLLSFRLQAVSVCDDGFLGVFLMFLWRDLGDYLVFYWWLYGDLGISFFRSGLVLVGAHSASGFSQAFFVRLARLVGLNGCLGG